jgi:hypothetical protein
VLAGLVTGAVLAGVLDAAAAAAVPLLPLLGVAAAVALGSGLLRPGWLDPGGPDSGWLDPGGLDPGTPTDPTGPTPPAGTRQEP